MKIPILFPERDLLRHIKTASFSFFFFFQFPIFSKWHSTHPVAQNRSSDYSLSFLLAFNQSSCLQSLFIKYLLNLSIPHFTYHHYSSSGHHCLLSKLLLEHPYGFFFLQVLHFPRIVSMVQPEQLFKSIQDYDTFFLRPP